MTEQKAAPDTPNLSDAARTILEKVGMRQEPPAAEAPQDKGSQQPTELEIDHGGIKRRVKVEDLTKAFTEREQTLAAAQAIQKQLAEAGKDQSLAALRDAIDGLDADRRAKVFSILQGTDEPEAPEDDEIDGLPPGRKPAQRSTPQPTFDEGRFSQLERAVQALAGIANKNHQTELHTTRQQQVRKLMESIPLFKNDPGAAGLAEDHILLKLATDPNATLEQVMVSTAQRLQQLQDAAKRGVVDEAGIPLPRGLRLPEMPKPKRQGDLGRALRGGDVRKAAERAFNYLKQQ